MVKSLDAVDEQEHLNNMHSVLRQSTDTVSILYATNFREKKKKKKTSYRRKCFKNQTQRYDHSDHPKEIDNRKRWLYRQSSTEKNDRKSYITIVGIPKHQSVIVQNHDESQYPGV